MNRFLRWCRFNGVGVLGIGVQVGLITWLTGPWHLHYRLATAIGVTAAVVHNFLWHWHWTWRGGPRPYSALVAFGLFAATNGAVSLGGNLVGMSLLVGAFGMPASPAALLTIAACGIGNFFAAEGILGRPRNRQARADTVAVEHRRTSRI